ncbi:epoxide hydrolase N-terminal domain-containing protein [Rhodococcus sp. NM-2]|nr:epoxide hydrolase N-terminal domain-containing protein [Rhodococcus sp. IEGM 1307]
MGTGLTASRTAISVGWVAYWRDGYEWRKAEAAVNAYEHHRVVLPGVSR